MGRGRCASELVPQWRGNSDLPADPLTGTRAVGGPAQVPVEIRVEQIQAGQFRRVNSIRHPGATKYTHASRRNSVCWAVLDDPALPLFRSSARILPQPHLGIAARAPIQFTRCLRIFPLHSRFSAGSPVPPCASLLPPALAQGCASAPRSTPSAQPCSPGTRAGAPRTIAPAQGLRPRCRRCPAAFPVRLPPKGRASLLLVRQLVLAAIARPRRRRA